MLITDNFDLTRDLLHKFLLEVGYPAAEIAFIFDFGKVVPKPPPEGRAKEVGRGAVTAVRHRERHLVTLFHEFDPAAVSFRDRAGLAAS